MTLPAPTPVTLPPTLAARIESSPDRASWLAARGIGGSAIAAILGIPTFAGVTEWSVWIEHQPGVQRVDRDDDRMATGRRIEPLVATDYATSTGRIVHRLEHSVIRHPEFPWATASPDGLAFDPAEPAGRQWGGLEIKVSTEPDDWADGVPANYLAQVRWYLHVTGLPWWDVAVWLTRYGVELRVCRIEADPAEQSRMFRRVAHWYYLHIVDGVEPELDASPAARRWVDRAAAHKDRGARREASEREAGLIASIEYHRGQRAEHDTATKLAEAELAGLCGDHTYAIELPGLRCTRVTSRGAPSVDLDMVRRLLPAAIKREGKPYSKFVLTTPKER